jgi:hypothetical protein
MISEEEFTKTSHWPNVCLEFVLIVSVRMCPNHVLKIRNLQAGRLLICRVLNCKLHIEREDPPIMKRHAIS